MSSRTAHNFNILAFCIAFLEKYRKKENAFPVMEAALSAIVSNLRLPEKTEKERHFPDFYGLSEEILV
ncbi:MAG: hypothetical protein ACI4V3_07105 [Faecousia sp.]